MIERASLCLGAALLLACGAAEDETRVEEPRYEEREMTTGEEQTRVEVERVPEEEMGEPEIEIDGQPVVAAAVADLAPTEGNDVRGTVRFEDREGAALVSLDVSGLAPNATHAIHVHENGDCSAPDASSAGDHFDPEGHPHALPGTPVRHAGDMGNFTANDQGRIQTETMIETFRVVDPAAPSVVMRAVVVHADPDDGSQPSGNAGPRLACGVILPEGAPEQPVTQARPVR